MKERAVFNHVSVQISLGLLGFVGLVAACNIGKGCPEAGCAGNAVIHVHEADWAAQSFDFELNIDGKIVICVSEGANPRLRCDDASVGVEQVENTDCETLKTANAVSQRCTRNGKFEHAVNIQGSPARVQATVTRPDGTKRQRNFPVVYQDFFPKWPFM